MRWVNEHRNLKISISKPENVIQDDFEVESENKTSALLWEATIKIII